MNFDENEIRPRSLDALRFEAQKKDLEWLRARRSDFVSGDCPVCSGVSDGPVYEKLGFTWEACGECHAAFMNPRPTPKTLGEFYARSELYKVWNEHVFPASRQVRRERIFRPRVERLAALCAEHSVGTDLLVEVGAAHGIFCDEVRETHRFSRVIAVEPSADQAETCRSLGLETIEATIETIDHLEGVADVVAAFEVIEHLANPADFVAAMARILKPGGMLVVSTPNRAGFEIDSLGAASDSIYPEHLTLFTPQSARRIVEAAGLTLVELTTPGVLDADIVRRRAREGVLDLSTQPFLQRVLLKDWEKLGEGFQGYLAEAGLSSHMWFVGQRSL